MKRSLSILLYKLRKRVNLWSQKQNSNIFKSLIFNRRNKAAFKLIYSFVAVTNYHHISQEKALFKFLFLRIERRERLWYESLVLIKRKQIIKSISGTSFAKKFDKISMSRLVNQSSLDENIAIYLQYELSELTVNDYVIGREIQQQYQNKFICNDAAIALEMQQEEGK